MDSSVLENHIIYPNDVQLVYKAFGKIRSLAHQLGLPLWFDYAHVKARWRAFNLAKKGNRSAFLEEFDTLFRPALKHFKQIVKTVKPPYKKKPNTGFMYSTC